MRDIAALIAADHAAGDHASCSYPACALAELTFDEAEAVGLDGTGMGMDPRPFPFRHADLTADEAALLKAFNEAGGS